MYPSIKGNKGTEAWSICYVVEELSVYKDFEWIQERWSLAHKSEKIAAESILFLEIYIVCLRRPKWYAFLLLQVSPLKSTRC